MAEVARMTDDPGVALSTPEGVRDPYPIYARLRETAPVCWSEAFNAWLVTGYREVRTVYRDYERFSSVGTVNSNFAKLPPEVQDELELVRIADLTSVLNTADPPEHTRHRGQIMRPLSPRQMVARRDWAEEVCRELLEGLAAQARPELIEGYTKQLSYATILGLFGAPMEDVAVYERTSIARAEMDSRRGSGPQEARAYEAALREFQDSLERVYAQKREHDDGSIIASLLHPEEGTEPLSDEERFALIKIFFAAGHTNLIYAPATTLVALLQRPDQLQLVREEPQLTAAAFEEGVRWDTPHQKNSRIARTHTELAGAEIRAGDLIFNVKASANRDPTVWTDPDRFDLTRDQHEPPDGSLTFGQGVHFCAGAGIARLAGPIGLASLIERFPQLELREGWLPEWRGEPLARLLTEVPLVLH